MAYLDELVLLHGDRLVVHVDDEGSSLQVSDLIEATSADTELYMCGPIRLMDAVRRSWAAAGRDVPSLRYETFGNSGWFDPEEFTVVIPRLNVEVAVPPGQSMLEALEAAGVDEPVVGLEGAQGGSHVGDGGDADAPGQQHIGLRADPQREVL